MSVSELSEAKRVLQSKTKLELEKVEIHWKYRAITINQCASTMADQTSPITPSLATTTLIEQPPEVQERVADILRDIQTSLPEGTTLEISDQFVEDVKNSMNQPHKTFEEKTKEVSRETIIDKTITLDNQQGQMINMRVTLDKANYGNFLYWNVVCDAPCTGPFHVHPLRNVCEKDDYGSLTQIGEVIADNEMIRKMFEFLTMDDDKLLELIGTCFCTVGYRARIIHAISLFWD